MLDELNNFCFKYSGQTKLKSLNITIHTLRKVGGMFTVMYLGPLGEFISGMLMKECDSVLYMVA